ncbi:hypothetical protein QBC37DRAFT_389750 [Rhypophila decipiens]|uniref:ubiquitinyl hydrolase 1 n=1 Tax=Rhypophila decipiens TaxID=261697 RepID=A0AAN7B610_9PEZI|nr:hypothetical protein QBC37DRAFT_389750 [Rhypophila decipiens]
MSSKMDFQLNRDALEFIFHHTFLPPKLPQKEDTNEAHVRALVGTFRDSMEGFLIAEPGSAPAIRPAVAMMDRFIEARSGADSDAKVRCGQISKLKPGDAALFHLRAQNAGLVLTRRDDGGILFQAFRLLAPNDKVMACKGALIREFPDRAAILPADTARDADFWHNLCDVIMKLDMQVAPIARPKSQKDGQAHPESRDTTSPLLVTGMMIDNIAGLGEIVEPERIVKRSREQVNWHDTLGSFHRSATWLLLRVTTRLVIDRQERGGGDGSKSLYKQLMAYHHGRILQIATAHKSGLISSDPIMIMQAKLARRIMKLDPSEDSSWLSLTKNVLAASQSLLDKRWKTAQHAEIASLPLDKLSSLSFREDCDLKMTRLRSHLDWIRSRSTQHSSSVGPGDLTSFTPLSNRTLPSLAGHPISGEKAAINPYELLEVEAWVESSLPTWTTELGGQGPRAKREALSGIATLIGAYRSRASSTYADAPEALSVMYLTIIELWVAMDKIAGKLIPLLLDYDPGFVPDLFHPLLLERKVEMERLKKAESYLSERKRGRYSSAFEDFGREWSFAARYYSTSSEHQVLREQIELWAENRKTEKMAEYLRIKEEYVELTRKFDNTKCDEWWSTRWRCYSHPSSCTRCAANNRRQNLQIEVFEWPLPEMSTYANALVVEISLPEVAKVWRDVTWELVSKTFRRNRNDSKSSDHAGSFYYGGSHCGLKQFCKTTSQVKPASTIKPTEVTHYRLKKITEATLSNVCVSHAPRYEYYDSSFDQAVSMERPAMAVPRNCSYGELVKGQWLEDWVRYRKHTPNDVIAGQAHCPPTTTLEEFRSFGNLRSGIGLQWANVLSQLGMPSIDFNKSSTFALVMQAVLEVGPDTAAAMVPESFRRETHRDTGSDSFVSQIVRALDSALERVRESWQNHVALALLTCLATRLLSVSPSDGISTALLEYLKQTRLVAIQWARALLEKLNESSVNEDRLQWVQRVLVTALIGMATFNMEEKHLSPILEEPHQLRIFIESAVMAKNHLPPSGKPLDPIAQQLGHRWHATMHRARESALRQIMEKKNVGLDVAIRSFWADYVPPGSGWAPRAAATQKHIVERRDSQNCITFNLLTGDLFVNGNPLSKLPLAYQQHTVFTELFGDQVLDVGPSSDPGMEFSACRRQHGWVVHFRMVDGHLVVRTAAAEALGDGGKQLETWEYIPRHHLKTDLTSTFVKNYAHWLNLSTMELEFRPLDSKWITTPHNWRLSCAGSMHILKNGMGSSLVVGPASPTAQLVNEILRAVEDPWDIDTTLDWDSQTLVINLPRLGLSFTVQEGSETVESKNYTGMTVDANQRAGTLIGLAHKLVLRPQQKHGFRRIVVPRGKIEWSYPRDSHVKVSIIMDGAQHGRHESFVVDDKLGLLIDAGSLHSKLYLCLLHAVTSHCLPDPLTSRTGTEEALRILQGAAVKSYPALDEDSAACLARIALLSPGRQFYPLHLKVMEQVKWDRNLPSLSQHDAFWTLALSIDSHYRAHEEVFCLEGKSLRDSKSRPQRIFEQPERTWSPLLGDRAGIRNANFRVSEFDAEKQTTKFDEWYRLGDMEQTGTAKNRAAVASLSRCVHKGQQLLLVKSPKSLTQTIVNINGDKFSGYRDAIVDLAFKVDNSTGSLKGLWCGLHRALAREGSKYRKMFFLSGLLYAEGSSLKMIQTLMALGNATLTFSKPPMFPPPDAKFDLTVTRALLPEITRKIVEEGSKGLDDCPERDLDRRADESDGHYDRRQKETWRDNSSKAVRDFSNDLAAQTRSSWTVSPPGDRRYSTYLNIALIMEGVREKVEMARRTDAFMAHMNSVQNELLRWEVVKPSTKVASRVSPSTPPSSKLAFVGAMSLFSSGPEGAGARLMMSLDCPELRDLTARCLALRDSEADKSHCLAPLVDDLSQSHSPQSFQSSYLAELRRSMASAVPTSQVSLQRDGEFIQEIQGVLGRNLAAASERHNAMYSEIGLALSVSSLAGQVCQGAACYPRLSPVFLLQRLTRAFWNQLSKQWQACLVSFALSLISLQRAERLHAQSLNLPKQWSDLKRELLNNGDHDRPDWDVLEYPERLLLEIEQGILTRPIQGDVAAVMRSPPNDRNAVMQLNMGEGKSSVIVPIVAAALADGHSLVRVVVAKPQASQMQHMLIGKLGRLINRPVFYLPFSRSIQLLSTEVQGIRNMIKKCQEEGGVLLVQPEHLLSFKLMGIDKSWAAEGDKKQVSALGKEIISLYREFERVSRDIVDESDENFSVKFELIYTMGAQEAVEMSPDRWVVIQHLLDMTEAVVRELLIASGSKMIKDGILFDDHGPRRVPLIRISSEVAAEELVKKLATQACQRGLTGFPIHHQTPRMQKALLNYILLESPPTEDVFIVEDPDHGLFSVPALKNVALLLRGLFAKGVFRFALGQKRYRVNYGLAPDRRPPTMLAVPYRAKDMPSPRSEFSHPDVVIMLTCLSYYYGGLSNVELYTCMELLSKSDQGHEEYGRWAVKSPGLPPSFRHFSAINLKDRAQCEDEVFPALRYTRATIDYYLAMVVFPKEMKQFPLKLSASGWDLARQKQHPMTGFSGTNDSKTVLPLSVKALDLQPHTNAAVLSTILSEENTVLELGGGSDQSQVSALTEDMLLGCLGQTQPAMRVILDVGAQIIESSNVQMATRFLESVSTAEADAVIFFNGEDELSVLNRHGVVDSFLTSPFLTQTDRCLVYLDQAHTRGTDLKLPENYRAAVTLGPGVTKDTLVQACMRMRKLGKGQSVTFIVSPEMQKRIHKIRGTGEEQPLVVSDVVAWALWETWNEEERNMPLWAVQGTRNVNQENIWRQAEASRDGFTASHARQYLEPDAMSLEKRYRAKPTGMEGDAGVSELLNDLSIGSSSDLASDRGDSQLVAIKKKLTSFTQSTRSGGLSFSSATLQEEQERELSPEIVQEAQLSRPAPRKALGHAMHPDVLAFAGTGVIPTDSAALLPAYGAMAKTSVTSLFGSQSGVSSFPTDLLVTRDFVRTVEETGPSYRSDSYQRGVQWILLSTCPSSGARKMVIVSQWEADQLKSVIEQRASGQEVPVKLHAYLPRATLTFQTMEDLDTYVVPDHTSSTTMPLAATVPPPPELIMQLNLFAGQVYLRNYDEYARLCRYLGLIYTAKREGVEEETMVVDQSDESDGARDGFVGKKAYPGECAFDVNPVPFLAEMYKKIRRDCVGGLEKTHMGRILAGEILTERDFDA